MGVTFFLTLQGVGDVAGLQGLCTGFFLEVLKSSWQAVVLIVAMAMIII